LHRIDPAKQIAGLGHRRQRLVTHRLDVFAG
jgi:hypothetical protein